MNTYLDFEKPLADLDRKIAELENLSGNGEGPSLQDEISRLREKSSKQLHELYKNLDPWRKTQVARHPERPHFKNYIAEAFEDFVPLAGDRVFGEDEAIVGGLAKFRGRSVVVMGHEKGRSTEGRIKHNFGMAHPEGYRKAVRLMDMAGEV
ncbi:MAG TPA: acetyl-CoA carboxylase carboxyl transferase subunit alpha, partial [Hyphomonadaceae bacterium]|nr:acetyl-CoA carboxylase carboxyl transferase subunit alpha [Hyphomonadaceae bacterium]